MGAEAYSAGEPFQREKRTLFARAWLPFAAAAQLAETGAFVNHTIGGWPLVAIRGADGVARAFRNVCRHQNMPVVDRPSGRCDQLRCRYHGWTYDLAGAFVSAPPLVAPEDAAAPGNHLEMVELVEQMGLLLARIEPGAAPAPDVALGSGTFATAVTTDIDGNWKAVVEVLLDKGGDRFLWPIAFLRRADGATILRQIVPRTFTRTRLVDLIFAAPGEVERATAAARTDAATDKTRAEARQKDLAAGTGPAASEAVAAFRREVAEACRD